ncbi:MAG: Fe(3+) ABC transporter substrate-binding protein [Candidatus Thermofonsia Clade 1 bacterium]|jgi:iron(III) transport system substrate-binding protein|uniref:Fe(3+) ABC transporter substrate-binding protein n=1 Tax=Candidatus Thermofonsia Clade 1 bacterium TaxID=2364210 RepID=A0A2M8PH50_9CHLR|nr:MAG: Fe(3+) ABC transporter substrate-binding protein [Candidatus Thermofonsia Clade 1 bacterium]
MELSMPNLRRLVTLALLAALIFAGVNAAAAQGRQFVNVYSSRHYGAMEQMFVEFTNETGIEVRLSQGSPQALLTRLEQEGPQTPADVFFSVDTGTLVLAAEKGLFQPIDSEVLRANVPEALRDPENRWFGLSQRLRTIVYNPQKVDPSELSTYEALADPKWSGRLCLRPATHIYTISLVASMIAALGEEKAEEVVRGWVANKPQLIDSDTRILETIAAGGCDVGITNHYYVGRLYAQNPDFNVKIFWANQADRGVHRNVAGAGVTANAANRENAIKLLEWLSDAEKGQAADQSGLPGGNYEFPVNAKAPINAIIASFGTPKIDDLPLTELGKYQQAAIDLLGRAGY